MMPGRRVPGFQSLGTVMSTQNLSPSRGRVTWKRLRCALVTSGSTSMLLVIFLLVFAATSFKYASVMTVGDSCV